MRRRVRARLRVQTDTGGTMSKEADYRARMEALGIWDDAFAGAVHDLCMMERDQAKTRTAWRAALAKGDKKAAELAELLMNQDKAIQAHRDALCLTPKALRRLQDTFGAQSAAPPGKVTPMSALEIVRKRREA